MMLKKAAWLDSVSRSYPGPDPRLIGGTDVAAISGIHPYKNPHDVWSRVVAGAETHSGEAAKWGCILEPVVAMSWGACQRVAVSKPEAIVGRPREWARASPDFVVSSVGYDEPGTEKNPKPSVGDLVEVKCTSDDEWVKWGKTGAPAHVVAQVQWYMGTMGIGRCWIAALVGGNKLRQRLVPFNEEMFDELLNRAQDFVDKYVSTKLPP